jgi:hypothetical protein
MPTDLEMFRERCQARALLWALGELSMPEAVDALHEWSVGRGLVRELGQDAVQAIIAEAFAEVRP